MKKLSTLLPAIFLLFNLVGCVSSDPAPQQDTFTFTYNGTEIMLNSDAAPVIAALGEPKSYTEEPSCAFDGLDKTYFYGSFYLSTYPLDGKDLVRSIWFTDDSVATEEGICIGSTRAAVEAAYGADRFNGINACTLEKGGTRLTMILTEDTVSSVQYEIMLQ